MKLALEEMRGFLADDVEQLARIGSFVWDPVTLDASWSPNCFRLQGYEPDSVEASAASFLQRVHPDDVGGVRAVARQAMADRKPGVARVRLLLSTGLVRHIEARARWIDTASGPRMVGTLRDVAHDDEREHAQTVQAHLLEQAQSLAHVGSWVWDTTSGVVQWSPELYRIMGVGSGHELSVDSFDQQVHPEDRPGLQATRALSMADGVPRPAEVRIVRPNGVVRTIRMHGRSVDGANQVYLGVVHDVTECRQAESRARQVQAMEMVGRLAGGVAHDFNNLMTIVLGNARLLRERFEADEIEEVIQAAESAAVLTERLLSLGASSQTPLTLVAIDDVVLGLKDLSPSWVGRRFEVDARSRSHVRADPRRLREALGHLVRNGCEAGAEDDVVSIRCWQVDDGVRIDVRDAGRGMSDEEMARAVEPFYTTKAEGTGRGMGLPMAQGVVLHMGGRLELQSGTEGTTVSVWLPSCLAAPATPMPAIERSDALVVLVVDDEPAVRTLSARLLRRAGMEVHEADGPKAALEFADQPLDVVVSDVAMPSRGCRWCSSPATRRLATGWMATPF